MSEHITDEIRMILRRYAAWLDWVTRNDGMMVRGRPSTALSESEAIMALQTLLEPDRDVRED